MSDNPEDYTYISPIYKMTKREAIKLAKELGDSPPEEDIRIYQDDKGKYYHD